MTINLMPQELKPKGYVVVLSKTLKKFALISLIVFIFGTVVTFGIFIFVSSRTRSSVTKQEQLKNDIRALEGTEQKLILISDRLNKIMAVKSSKNADSGVLILQDVTSLFSEGISPKGVHLNDEASEISVFSNTLSNLSRFMAILSGSGKFSTVYLVALNYDTELGYSASFGFIK